MITNRKVYFGALLIIALIALFFIALLGITILRETDKYFSLKRNGIETDAKVLKKELVGFDGGKALIYYKFTDSSNNSIEGWDDTDVFRFNKINVGDIIKIKYIANNQHLNGISENGIKILFYLLLLIIPLLVFILGIKSLMYIKKKDKISIDSFPMGG